MDPQRILFQELWLSSSYFWNNALISLPIFLARESKVLQRPSIVCAIPLIVLVFFRIISPNPSEISSNISIFSSISLLLLKVVSILIPCQDFLISAIFVSFPYAVIISSIIMASFLLTANTVFINKHPFFTHLYIISHIYSI